MTKPVYLTLETVERFACTQKCAGLRRFKRLFGDNAEVTADNLAKWLGPVRAANCVDGSKWRDRAALDLWWVLDSMQWSTTQRRWTSKPNFCPCERCERNTGHQPTVKELLALIRELAKAGQKKQKKVVLKD